MCAMAIVASISMVSAEINMVPMRCIAFACNARRNLQLLDLLGVSMAVTMVSQHLRWPEQSNRPVAMVLTMVSQPSHQLGVSQHQRRLRTWPLPRIW
jgi:hypothetical protein